MNRKAAIDKLLLAAEETANRGEFGLSNTINDLARRIALSSYKISDKKVIKDSVFRMAAELMFRDDFKTANNLKKIADDLNLNEESGQSDEIPPSLMTPEETMQSNSDYINYLKARLEDPDITEFEKEEIKYKLNSMGIFIPNLDEKSVPPSDEYPNNTNEENSNFLDTLEQLGVELNVPKDLLN